MGEVRGARKSLEEFDMNLMATPVKDQGGDVIGIVGVAQDISERKGMEEVLREIEERCRLAAEAATYALIMVDEERRILFVNRAAENIFGYTTAEMLGQRLTMLVPEDLRNGHRALLQQYIDTGKERVVWSPVELMGRRKCGEEIPLEICLGEFIRNGKHIFAGIVRDISERKRAEDAMRETELKAKEVEALQRIDLLRKDLIATVSHELRNPLASIKGYISTLLQPDVKWNPERQREFLEIADQEAERLGRLVGDLLTMSQLEAGVLKLDRERILLVDMLNDLDAHLGPLVSKHSLRMGFLERPPAGPH